VARKPTENEVLAVFTFALFWGVPFAILVVALIGWLA
jgi:hypothetical protein